MEAAAAVVVVMVAMITTIIKGLDHPLAAAALAERTAIRNQTTPTKITNTMAVTTETTRTMTLVRLVSMRLC